MSYNFASVSSGSGIDVATDTVSGYAVQVIKLDVGGDGASIPVIGSASFGIPVDVTRSVSVSGNVSLTGTGNVFVTNFPSTQIVSGTVAIGNFPGTQTVNGTVSVGNFPSTQVVSGTINVGNTVTVSGTVNSNATQAGTWTVQPGNTANTTPWLTSINHAGNTATVTAASALKVDNSGVTQTISGSVTVNNLPATQVVSGTVSIGNIVTTAQNVIESPFYVAQGEAAWYSVQRAAKGTFTTLLAGEMNSLTNSSISNLGSAFDNSAAGYRYGDFELLVTYGSNPTAGTQVELFLVPALDGSNYSDGSSALVSVNNYVGGFVLRATTAAQRVVLRDISLPQSLFKVHVRNSSGQTMAASNNTLKLLPVLGNR